MTNPNLIILYVKDPAESVVSIAAFLVASPWRIRRIMPPLRSITVSCSGSGVVVLWNLSLQRLEIAEKSALPCRARAALPPITGSGAARECRLRRS